MKIFVEDDFIYALMKCKGTKLIVEADALIDRIKTLTKNQPDHPDDVQRIENIKLNTRGDGTIQLIATGGNEFIIGYKKEDEKALLEAK